MLALPLPPPGPEALLQVLLDASATGIALLSPVYGAGQPEEIVDFTYQRLNPAAQRVLGLPEQPAATLLRGAGPPAAALAFYRATFLADEPGYFYLSSSAVAGVGLRVAAQRSGAQLVVSFTEVPQPGSAAPAEGTAPAGQVFRQVFDQTPAAICLLHGPEHRFEYVNPAFERLFPGRQLLGRTVAEALPEALPQGVAKHLDQVYQTGEAYAGVEAPLSIAQPHGRPPRQHYFNFIYQAHPMHGQPARLSLLANDVTDKVLARQQRDAQWAEHQQVFEQAPVAIAVLRGPEHVVELANPAICALWNCRLPQLLGRPLFEVLPAAAGAYLRPQRLADMLATGASQLDQVQTTLPHLPGHPSAAYLNLMYHSLREADGQISGLVLVIADVSEQVHGHQHVQQLNEELHVVNEQLRAANEELHSNNQELAQTQQELRQLNQELEYRVASGVRAAQQARDAAERQRQRLASFFRQVPAAVCALDGPDLVFELVNPSYQQFFPGRALLGRPLREAAPELLALPLYQQLRQVYATGVAHEGHEVPLAVRLHEGEPLTEHYFNCVYLPRHNDQGRTDGVLVFAIDVTPEVLARQQADQAAHKLRLSNEQLTRTNTDLDTFIYTASHDLKSPIANIEGLLLLLRQQLPAEARQAGLVPRVLDMMQGAIERFQLTIAQLTDLAKLQHAHTQPAEEVDLPALVEAVRLDLAPLLEEAHAELHVNLDSCSLVSFAPQHLRSIIYNLLSNAIKYRHLTRPLLVHLRGRRTAVATVLEVQDNGLGLSDEQQGKLFSMFRRLHDHVPGSGVGLYMVKRIVENAGGTIQVRSQTDIGSIFTVSFPS